MGRRLYPWSLSEDQRSCVYREPPDPDGHATHEPSAKGRRSEVQVAAAKVICDDCVALLLGVRCEVCEAKDRISIQE